MQNPICPKIVFFDIDDTIYQKTTDTLRPSVFQAFKMLKQKGILTAIATGRPEVAIPKKVREAIAEAEMDMLVTINGQYIRYRGEELGSHPMDREKVGQMSNFFEQHNIAFAFVAPDTITVSADTPPVVAAMSKILPEHPIDPTFYQQNHVYQMLAFYDDAHENVVAEEVAKHGYKTVRWHEQAVDMLDKTGSKARGIQSAISKLGIDMKDVMAFGDGLNDIEMMQAVGFGVCMGNGEPELKAVADYICPTIDEDGVLNGLKALGVID